MTYQTYPLPLTPAGHALPHRPAAVTVPPCSSPALPHQGSGGSRLIHSAALPAPAPLYVLEGQHHSPPWSASFSLFLASFHSNRNEVNLSLHNDGI